MLGLNLDVRLDMIGFAPLIVLLIAPCIAIATQIRRYLVLPRVFLFAMVLLLLGIAAETMFFATMITRLGATALACIAAVYGGRQTVSFVAKAVSRRSLQHVDVWAPFALTAGAALSYLGLACFSVPGTGSILRSIGSWLTLPPDNFLPHFLAMHIGQHLPPKPFFAEWLSSDRPPLQAGFDLLFAAVTPFADDSQPRYQVISMLLQASSFGMLFTLCRLCGRKAGASAGIVCVAWASGFFFLNTLFVWPKLLAAAYLCVAVSLFFAPGALTIRRAATIGLSFALAFLSHGGVIFAVPVLILAWALSERRRFVRLFAVATVVAVSLLGPWIWYQRIYDPPGDRLLKWHLAGQIAVTNESFLKTFLAAYRDRPLATIANFKVDNFGPPLGINSTVVTAIARKDREFYFVRDAMSALIVPFVAALFFVRSNRRTLRMANRLAWLAVGGNVFWCLAIYSPGSTVIHVGSYFTMLLMFAAGGIVASEWLIVFVPIAIIQYWDFSTAWLPLVALRNVGTSGGICGATVLLAVAIASTALLVPNALMAFRAFRGRYHGSQLHVLLEPFRQYAKSDWRGVGIVAVSALVLIVATSWLKRNAFISVPPLPIATVSVLRGPGAVTRFEGARRSERVAKRILISSHPFLMLHEEAR